MIPCMIACMIACINFPASIETPHLKIPRVIRLFTFSSRISLKHTFKFNCPLTSTYYSIHTVWMELSKMNSNIFSNKWAFPPSNIPYHTCNHRWALLKSKTILIFWSCQICSSGPWQHVYQCLLCRHKVCRQCVTEQCSIKD